MDSDPALAKRLEDNVAQRAALANLEAEVVQSEVGANPSKRARQDEAAPQDSVITGGASSSVTESDVDMQTIPANDRWIQATMTRCVDWTCATSSTNVVCT